MKEQKNLQSERDTHKILNSCDRKRYQSDLR